ncbi:hypothetical protein HYPBUDRAFT_153258 [Hyphopichia burtonii NRRL Y-1933]|uniref:Large ribosomal subunit protein mL59 domain-containing protein n=1 Tax=Hyphopichia burtonii NRRL Y-1933 TaxID=984485 RepID=A0A1E4RGK6_9ASCO|nr:hypothetical protein HYPBUDRAFT_153258 [Hyphopichia burtonii NRRL Y-1933]ODV66390.1 hypothetical protein HYPBUDRAFT_153258 [Hyphopichia burtonii NRRL Y-1933]
MSLTPKQAFNKLPQRLHNFFIKYPPRPFAQYAEKPTNIQDPNMNPFLPNKNLDSGRWQEAKYSLRRASDLFKMAYKFGIQDLLPPLPQKRFFEDKYENKKWMKGVLKQKQQVWERKLPEKLQARKEALENMDQTIIAARPRYKKQLQKKEQRKNTWF